jgi:uracil-DNA glycosylase family 4
MSENISEIIKNSLLTQKEIFGDELYEPKRKTVKKEAQKNISPTVKEPISEAIYEADNFASALSLDELYSEIHTCQKCALSKSRTKFVFGAGNPNADIMLIGEAPGAEEDKTGVPFVGRAGNLLNDILKAIELTREEIYIANILKCRPPKNRDPEPEERDLCIPYLLKQIDLIKPKMILCLGRIAANTLLGTNQSLTKLRENVHEFHGVPMMATFHPAALLRNPNWKRPVWEDVQKFRKMYDEMLADGK